MNPIIIRNYEKNTVIGLTKVVLKRHRPMLHRNFEERLAEYDGQITVTNFDWGEPKGRELL